jgi:hypothetical protein
MKHQIVNAPHLEESGRIDAKYYLSPGVRAAYQIAGLKAKGVQCIRLDSKDKPTKIWTPLRFKSAYAAEDEEKVAYLRPYDVFQYLPTATHYLSATRNSCTYL